MRKYLGILIIILATVGLYFLMKPAAKHPVLVPGIASRIFKTELTALQVTENDLTKKVFDISGLGDSLFIFSDNGYFIAEPTLQQGRMVGFPRPVGTIYYYTRDGSRVCYYDVDKRLLSFSDGTTNRTHLLEGNPGRACFTDGSFIYDIGTLRADNDTVQIRAWDPVSDHDTALVDLNQLFARDLHGRTTCLEETLEGSFFKIDDKRWGFMFYNAGKFIVGDGKKHELHSTIDGRPFKTYQQKSVQLNGSQRALVCQAENESCYNYGAVAADGNLYVLSGVIDQQSKPYTPIDVYDANTFGYKYTLKAPAPSVTDYATSIALAGDNLFLQYTESRIMRFTLPKGM